MRKVHLVSISSIKKKDLADFFRKLAMLLQSGHDAYTAVRLLAKPGHRSHRDKSANGLRAAAKLLLPSLEEGVPLPQAMQEHPKVFGKFAPLVRVGDYSGKTSEVLSRLSERMRNEGHIASRLQAALTYPAFVLVATLVAAIYLFTSVVPELLGTIQSMGVYEVPATTQLIMDIGTWLSENGPIAIPAVLLIVLVLVIYYSTVGRTAFAKIAARAPLVGNIVADNSVASFIRNWQQMLLAGAEMSVSLKSGCEAITNRYIRKSFLKAYKNYAENGVPVAEALRAVPFLTEMELQTIEVAFKSDTVNEVLDVLGEDREYEANNSLATLSAAVNPIILIIVGLLVGVFVMSIYEPIMSASTLLH